MKRDRKIGRVENVTTYRINWQKKFLLSRKGCSGYTFLDVNWKSTSYGQPFQQVCATYCITAYCFLTSSKGFFSAWDYQTIIEKRFTFPWPLQGGKLNGLKGLCSVQKQIMAVGTFQRHVICEEIIAKVFTSARTKLRKHIFESKVNVVYRVVHFKRTNYKLTSPGDVQGTFLMDHPVLCSISIQIVYEVCNPHEEVCFFAALKEES